MALPMVALLLLTLHLPAEAASFFGPPNGQGVFTIESAVPAGHGSGFFELSLDSAFRLQVTTVAGAVGQSGAINDTALAAKFNNPAGLARDSQGNVFVADSGNHCIRMINAAGVVTTIAGSSQYGLQDGPGSTARFAFPCAVALGPDNNLYVSDTNNTAIRKIIRPSVEGSAWVVTTLAGTNSSGFFDGSGAAARFSSPQGLAVDASGNVYVADAGNHRIRRITSLGSVSTYAGSAGGGGFADGAAIGVARFNSPYAVAVDSAGNVFVADRLNQRIRRITPGGVVSTYAGSGATGGSDGSLLAASFNQPVALAIDDSDVLYVSDEAGHRIRRVTPEFGPDTVTTVAGTGLTGSANGTGDAATFNSPAGLVVLGNGDVLVADSENHCLRRLAATFAVQAQVNGAPTQVIATIDPPALGIAPGTYFFRWRAGDWTVVNDGLSKLITTVVPAVTMIPADPVNAGEATLRALVNPRNLAVNQVKFQYSTDPEFAAPIEVNGSPLPTAGGLDVTISYELSYPSSTPAGTVYYFRAVAINDYGTAVASELESFAVPAATVVTDAADQIVRTNLRQHQARLRASIDAKGSGMDLSFEYSTQPSLFDAWRVGTVVDAPAASSVRGVAVGAGGEIYFSRSELNRIDALVGGALVGSITAGFADGTFAEAKFDRPAGLAYHSPVAGTHLLYVADERNHRIRRINLGTGMVSTLAGSGIAGKADGSAGSARFLYPTAVAVDTAGNVYVADTGNHCIRRIAALDGSVTTVAGTGVAGLRDGSGGVAQFSSPAGLVCAADGSILVADVGNHRIAKISSVLEVSTLAGTGAAGFADGQPLNEAQFSSPSGLVLDVEGNLFIADRGNHRIRRLSVGGLVSTIAGSASAGSQDSPLPGQGLVPATVASFSQPLAIAINAAGALLVADSANASLRRIEPVELITLAHPPALAAHGLVSTSRNTLVLSPGTTYYYRAVGDNRMDGLIRGEIRSFTTATEPAIEVYDGADSSAALLAHQAASAVNFGVVAVATQVTRQFTVSNTGGWELTLNSIQVPAGYTVLAGPSSVPAGQSRTFSVVMDAAVAGIYAGNLEIASDDPDRLAFESALTGKKVNPPVIHQVGVRNLALAPTEATLDADVDPNGAETSFEFEVSPGPDFDGVRVTTLADNPAGNGDGPLESAQFGAIAALALDAAGNVYVADRINHNIRRISTAGEVSTLAGSGEAGFANGPGPSARFNMPSGIAVAADGRVFVADTGNHRIRVIDASGNVSTFSGTGEANFTDGIASAARFALPMGMAFDAAGSLMVADAGNHRVRSIAADGSVSTLVVLPNGSAPVAVVTTQSGELFVSSPSLATVYRISSAGGLLNDFGILGRPSGLAYDEAMKELYVADEFSHLIRRINAQGAVTVWAGSGTAGSSDDLGPVARFDEPTALAMVQRRTVLVVETGGALRKVLPTVIKVPAPTTLQDPRQMVTLEVGGLDPSVIHYFRAIATSVGGQTVRLATLPLGTEFTQWQLDHFGSSAADSEVAGPAANPSGDGISNLMKYALGLDPLQRIQPEDPRLPQLQLDRSTSPWALVLSLRQDPAAPNVRLFFESSANKLDWSSDRVSSTTDGVGNLRGALPLTTPANPSAHRFLRVGVELLLP